MGNPEGISYSQKERKEMYELFYIDKDGNYGEARGMLVINPSSVPDEWREKIADAMEAGKEQVLQVINEYCCKSGALSSEVVVEDPKMFYTLERLRREEEEFLMTRLVEGISTESV